jgi:outer membrane protein OmpA-like peptidoglycan-associated protein
MMHKPFATTLLLMAALMTGCSTPATRVILLPEPGGKVTALEVKSDIAKQRLTAPYQTAEVSKSGQVDVLMSDPLVVLERYGALLTQLPAAEEQFILYFEPGGAELTAESQALLPKILARANARKGGEILVVGHTDRVGAVEANDALSLQRARSVRDVLVGRSFKPDLVEAVGRGERSPVVATEDEVAEPKNRRAEIVVR